LGDSGRKLGGGVEIEDCLEERADWTRLSRRLTEHLPRFLGVLAHHALLEPGDSVKHFGVGILHRFLRSVV
jgi:hypothetical protein